MIYKIQCKCHLAQDFYFYSFSKLLSITLQLFCIVIYVTFFIQMLIHINQMFIVTILIKT